MYDRRTMIFFFSSTNHADPKEPLREQFTPKELDKHHATGKAKLHSWQFYFDSEEQLLDAVLSEAKVDTVCKDMVARFRECFELDLLDGSRQSLELWKGVVHDWCDPMTGNIEGMENKVFMARAMTGPTQAEMWRKNKAIPAGDQMFKVLEDMPPPTRAHRDQVRVFQSITSAARAITGEVSCSVSNRLEKLLALRLCRSTELLGKQKQLLLSCLPGQTANLLESIAVDGEFATSAQYCSYYLPGMSRLTTVEGRQALFLRLLNVASGSELSLPAVDSEGDQAIIGDSLIEFEKLPPVIRCAMLLNDLKRVNKKIAGVKVETFSRVGLAPRERGSGRHSVLKEGRPLKYIPQINNFITSTLR